MAGVTPERDAPAAGEDQGCTTVGAERTAMTSIRWVCISDLHLGALNSLLTNVTSDGERCDNTCSSPVLTALCECLRSLRTPGQDPPELVVLGDLFELALTAPEDAAGAFSQF